MKNKKKKNIFHPHFQFLWDYISIVRFFFYFAFFSFLLSFLFRYLVSVYCHDNVLKCVEFKDFIKNFRENNLNFHNTWKEDILWCGLQHILFKFSLSHKLHTPKILFFFFGSFPSLLYDVSVRQASKWNSLSYKNITFVCVSKWLDWLDCHTYIHIHNWPLQPISQDYCSSFSHHLCCVC